MRWAPAVVLAAAGLAQIACEPRGEPYRFRGPVVGGVAAGDPRPEAGRDPAPETTAGPTPAEAYGGDPLDAASEAIRVQPPDPSRGGLRERLRALVGGEREGAAETDLAFDVVQRMGVSMDDGLLGIQTAGELIEAASAREALTERDPLLGDLVIFEPGSGGGSRAVVGVVVATHRQGTVEFIYEARGIVRRGYATPAEPARARDDAGRPLNIYLRAAGPGDARDERYLAGELFETFVRIDRLTR